MGTLRVEATGATKPEDEWRCPEQRLELHGLSVATSGVDGQVASVHWSLPEQYHATLRPRCPNARKKKRRAKQEKNPQQWRTAKTSDRHELYELSVQNVESEIDFIDQVWQEAKATVCQHDA